MKIETIYEQAQTIIHELENKEPEEKEKAKKLREDALRKMAIILETHNIGLTSERIHHAISDFESFWRSLPQYYEEEREVLENTEREGREFMEDDFLLLNEEEKNEKWNRWGDKIEELVNHDMTNRHVDSVVEEMLHDDARKITNVVKEQLYDKNLSYDAVERITFEAMSEIRKMVDSELENRSEKSIEASKSTKEKVQKLREDIEKNQESRATNENKTMENLLEGTLFEIIEGRKSPDYSPDSLAKIYGEMAREYGTKNPEETFPDLTPSMKDKREFYENMFTQSGMRGEEETRRGIEEDVRKAEEQRKTLEQKQNEKELQDFYNDLINGNAVREAEREAEKVAKETEEKEKLKGPYIPSKTGFTRQEAFLIIENGDQYGNRPFLHTIEPRELEIAVYEVSIPTEETMGLQISQKAVELYESGEREAEGKFETIMIKGANLAVVTTMEEADRLAMRRKEVNLESRVIKPILEKKKETERTQNHEKQVPIGETPLYF